MRVRELLAHLTARLSDNQIPDSQIEAEVILRHVLRMERAKFFAAFAECVSPRQRDQALHLLRSRMNGEPLAYIIGHREFYGLDFEVNSAVLIPRQETELLVDCVLEYCSRHRPGESVRIADVGTGSGAIAIAIAANLPQADIFATDCDSKALAVADINRRKHSVSQSVHLCLGDLLNAVEPHLDVIVSNPPYIRSADIPLLAPEVRREPLHALDGGADGLDVIRRLFQQAPRHIKPGGRIFLEIAPELLEPVLRLGHDAFGGADISFARDLLNLPRVVIVAMVASPA